jgi:hypothetical protein
MFNHKTIRAYCLLAGSLFVSAAAFAQGGAGEVAVFGGGTTISSGGGTHALVGGSIGARVAGHLRIFGEFSVVPLASLTETSEGITASGTDRLYNIGGGVDYSLGSSKTVVPYVLGAAGLSHDSVSATASGGGISATVGMSSNAAYYGVGGGVRIYVGHKWGVKPEVRYQRYTSSGGGSASAANFTVGLFYDFGK